MGNFRGGGDKRGGFRGKPSFGDGDKGGFRGGKGGFRGGREGGSPRHGGARPELHEVKCSDCGKDTMVPFRPTGDKPVYCRECFSRHGGGQERGREAGARGFRPERGGRDERPMRAPERADNFAPRPTTPTSNNIELKRELEQVNQKLERLIVAVQALAVTPANEVDKPVKKTTKKPAKKTTKK